VPAAIGYGSDMVRWSAIAVAVALVALLAVRLLEAPAPPASAPAAGGEPAASLAREAPGPEPPEIAPVVPAPDAPDPAVPPAPAPLAGAPAPLAAGTPDAVPLERLLKLPAQGPGASVGLEVDRNPHLRAGAPEPDARREGSLRDRVRVEHREEPAGVGGREKTVGQTEASVRVPVKDSVDLRGGVRVDSQREGSGEIEEVEPAPSVGIDVRF